jgi:hypothetical protein
MENKKNGKERFFSVELNSKRNLKNVTLTNGSSDSVLLEGTVGELVKATFKEGIILEVIGKKVSSEWILEKTKLANQPI